MNWFNFLLSLAIGYVIYYVLNILYDLYFNASKETEAKFDEEIIIPHHPAAPIKITLASSELNMGAKHPTASLDENAQALTSAPLESTGGVSIQELFSLMQSEVIEYTKAIPY